MTHPFLKWPWVAKFLFLLSLLESGFRYSSSSLSKGFSISFPLSISPSCFEKP
jgi:hypothetical protein